MKRTEKITIEDDLVFQPLSWSAFDAEYGDESGDDEGNYDDSKYLIKVYGCTQEGYSVSLNILNFTPFFYIRIDHRITPRFITDMHAYIVSKLPWQLKNSLANVKTLKRKEFWGFTNFKEFNFARITFKNLKGFRAGIRIFNNDVRLIGMPPTRYKLYETNIEPFLRMMHIRELQPSGWCKVPYQKYNKNSGTALSNCQIDLECSWKDIEPLECDRLAPYVIASFDIECTSSHGDFPVAKKDYRKVANELVNWFYEHKEDDPDVVKEQIQDELVAIFTASGGTHLSRVYPKSEQSIDAIKGIVHRHIDDIINILCGHVIYKGATKITREYIVNLLTRKFGTYDISIQDRREIETWIGIFPQLEGDNIIQIGTTVHKYGEKQCCYKSIITLGTCDSIDGVDVQQCETEEDLLLRWRDLIISLDPDILIGYNIFGFDMAYMADRAKEKGILSPFLKCGRINGQECKYERKMLSSSALGDNIMKFIDVDGRVLIDIMKVVQRDHKLDSFKLDNVAHHFIGMKKNDVHPNDIFRLQKGTSADRRVIAEYCIQDCALCNLLTMKLEIIANNIGMSNVCSVPLSYIFMRGQGIKIFSLVAKECRNDNFLIPCISKPWGQKIENSEDDGYEGAIVLEPKTGIYIDEPICVLDYASLYPSSMISENLSHDCIVLDPKYDNLPGIEYLDISYDIYEGAGDKKKKIGEKQCRFVQLPDNNKGIIPRTLQKLLGKRKETRKKIEWQTVTCVDEKSYKGFVDKSDDNNVKVTLHDGTKIELPKEQVVSIEDTFDDFQKVVLDGLQLAYKVTANSLYGQIGARTSQIYMKDIAACTTATGRKMIMLAKDYIEKNNDNAEVIYGDTDSLFIKFCTPNVSGKDAIPAVRELGIRNSKEIKKLLKAPHDLEWEKIFYPFILLSKKRYVANKYEWDDHKCKQNSMGIVLKRRDNANIVKKIYGGIIDIILNEQNVQKSIDFLTNSLNDLTAGKYPMEDLVITKSLRSDYKDPEKIAHKMLADRIKERDPGNAPNVNDRIPFVYIKTVRKPKGEKTLQGERIETPEFIKTKGLQPDYEFYITNQVMNPILQVYTLVLEQLPGYQKDQQYWYDMYDKVLTAKNNDEKKTAVRIDDLKAAEVKRLLFDPILTQLQPPKPPKPPKPTKQPKQAKPAKPPTRKRGRKVNSLNLDEPGSGTPT